MREINYVKTVEKWDIFEMTVPGYSENNPFTDYDIQGKFSSKKEDKVC